MLRRPGPPLLLAALCVVALGATGVLAYLVPVAKHGDSVALAGFLGLERPWLSSTLHHVAHLANPAPYALAGLALTLVALARGRWRVALAIPIVLVVAGTTTELLKHLLAAPHLDEWLKGARVDDASWPSGHATAAMTLALTAVMAAPPRARPTVAALGGLFAIGVAYSILALGWHLPSDVLGGYLVAATTCLLALAALAAAERRWPSSRQPEASTRGADVIPAVAIATAVAGIACGLAITRPRTLLGYAEAHTTFVAGAAVIAILALALAVALAFGIRTGTRSAAG